MWFETSEFNINKSDFSLTTSNYPYKRSSQGLVEIFSPNREEHNLPRLTCHQLRKSGWEFESEYTNSGVYTMAYRPAGDNSLRGVVWFTSKQSSTITWMKPAWGISHP